MTNGLGRARSRVKSTGGGRRAGQRERYEEQRGMSVTIRTALLVVSVTLLAGCQTPFFGGREKRVEPLAAVPSGEVQQSLLPPPTDLQNNENTVAALPPDASNPAEAERINQIGDEDVSFLSIGSDSDPSDASGSD